MLAINFGGLGDEILFLPTLKSIKLEHPDWHITLLTEPRSAAISQLTNLIDANIKFDIKKQPLLPGDYLELISLLRMGRYDAVLSSGSSPLVSILLFTSGIPTRIGYDAGALSKTLLTAAVPLNRDQYAGYMYHDLVRGLGITSAPEPPTLEANQESLTRMSLFLEEATTDSQVAKGQKPNQRVLIHPGSSQLALQKGINKTWSIDNWCELIRRLVTMNCQVVLAGGPDDEKSISEINNNLGQSAQFTDSAKGRFINAYGRTKSICDLVALMQLSQLIVCVDSAPMHIAAGLQKRVVALFGPTDAAKLLLQSDRIVALEEKHNKGAMNQPQEGVLIPLDVVFHTVIDQLTRASVQESSLEFRRS